MRRAVVASPCAQAAMKASSSGSVSPAGCSRRATSGRPKRSASVRALAPSGVRRRGIGAGLQQGRDVRRGAAAPDRPQERRAPVRGRRAGGRLVGVAAMGEQQAQRLDIVEIEHAIERIAAGDAGARLQQHTGAGRVLQGMIERLAVIRIGAGGAAAGASARGRGSARRRHRARRAGRSRRGDRRQATASLSSPPGWGRRRLPAAAGRRR